MKRKTFIIALVSVFAAVVLFHFVALRTEAESITAVNLPPGYRMDRYIEGLTFPTGIAWDESGAMYISEAAIGDDDKQGLGQRGEESKGRIVKVAPDFHEVVFEDLNSPVTDLKIRDGRIYVAHKGHLSVIEGDSRTDLLENLPYGDHFTCEIAFGLDGWVYLGNGTVTNAGVVGEDSFSRGWAATDPQIHDSPAKDLVLTGQNFSCPDPITVNPFDNAVTGGFLPFGTESEPGQTIPSKTQAGGVVYRVKEDGSEPQVYAWGLRNPLGLGYAPDGQLIAIDQGYQDRGQRPVANSPDPVFCVKQDAWYGWPDFVAGEPISDPQFLSPAKNTLMENLILEHPQKMDKPITVFEPGTGAMKFDFAPDIFDKSQRMYVAAFGKGDIASALSGSKGLAHGLNTSPFKVQQVGNCVMALDLDSGQYEPFASNKSNSPAGLSFSGFNHPIDAKFGPDDSLYVVDFGVIETAGNVYRAVPGTGVVWKISIQRSELKLFRETCMALLAGKKPETETTEDPDPWDPDYSSIQKEVEVYLGSLEDDGQKWGVFFKDLTSGKTFGINEDLQVPAASTVKVAVVLYASDLVSRGELSWNERLTYYAHRDWRGGSGTLQYTAEDGDTFTLRELAEKAITHSDNVAWKMLEARLGKENLINFMKEMGGQSVYPGGQNISTARDNATYMEAALNFSKDNPEGEKLMFDLANTIWNTGLNRFIQEVQVAHKEGDITGVADDVGVVFADKPYIISIMSEGHDDVEEGFKRIGEVSKMVFDYHTSLPR